MRRRLGELAGAVALLTRFPLSPRFQPNAAPPAEAVWSWPLIGAAVGGIAGGVFWLGRALALPPALAALWALAAMIAATGGFHEDGLADTADGFGGGAIRARKLEIMRDSRVGTFGVLALVLSLAIRAGAMVAIGDPARVVAALVVAGALGRAAMAGIMAGLAPARADGLGVGAGRPSLAGVATAFGVAGVSAFALLPAPTAALATVLAGAAGLATGLLARAQIGGYTGDVLGAGEQAVECVVLTLLARQFGA